MNALLGALAPAQVFYPLFMLLIVLWAGVRALIRRGTGARRWDERISAIERILLTIMILAMVGLAVYQIILRNLFHRGELWIEPLLRYLVLWIGFVAAVVATGRLRHVQINVIGRLLPPAPQIAILRVTLFAAALICAVLARAAWVYLADEEAFGSTGFLGIPVWALTSVIFAGFSMMAARFAVRAGERSRTLQSYLREGDENGA
ncbi:MAG: TRAP transporter small permease subunit [Candidatus Eisenbacteria bacterium]